MADLQLGLRLMGYGLSGVFSVLFIFILMILGLTRLFPQRKDGDDR